MPPEAKLLQASSAGMEWDRYVFAHPRSTGYHQMAWRRVIEQVFGHKTFYLTAQHDHNISGILP
jgi:hypothetical protein